MDDSSAAEAAIDAHVLAVEDNPGYPLSRRCRRLRGWGSYREH
jgi:hypothetical protein